MSSTYRAICLGHDPAIELAPEWNDPDTALAAATRRDGPLADHTKCDLLIGRYSSPIIELACPAGARHPRLWHPHGPEWIDADWLQLILAVIDDPKPEVVKALKHVQGGSCWTLDRVRRLRNLLNGGEDQ